MSQPANSRNTRKIVRDAITYIQGKAVSDAWTSTDANWPLLNNLRKMDHLSPVTPKSSPQTSDFTRKTR